MVDVDVAMHDDGDDGDACMAMKEKRREERKDSHFWREIGMNFGAK